MKRIPGESISGKLSEVWRSMCSQRVRHFRVMRRYYSPRSFLASYLAIKFTVSPSAFRPRHGRGAPKAGARAYNHGLLAPPRDA